MGLSPMAQKMIRKVAERVKRDPTSATMSDAEKLAAAVIALLERVG